MFVSSYTSQHRISHRISQIRLTKNNNVMVTVVVMVKLVLEMVLAAVLLAGVLMCIISLVCVGAVIDTPVEVFAVGM